MVAPASPVWQTGSCTARSATGLDRDVLGSRNTIACAVPQDRPSKGSDEGEPGDDGSNPPEQMEGSWLVET